MAVRRVPLVAILFAAVGAVALAAVALPSPPSSSLPVREVVLDARGVAFLGEGTNPAIEARPGERIRIVVRNTDPGVVHAIGAPELHPEVLDVRPGESAAVEVVAPGEGEYEYLCTHHYPLMRGRIVVRP